YEKTEDGKYKCLVCKKFKHTNEEILNHIKLSHQTKLQEMRKERANTLCELCGKDCEIPSLKKKHKESAHAQELNIAFRCSIPGCELSFTNKQDRNNHEKTHAAFMCEYCLINYSNKYTLQNHSCGHRKKTTPFACQSKQCKENQITFSSALELRDHKVQTHIK